MSGVPQKALWDDLGGATGDGLTSANSGCFQAHPCPQPVKAMPAIPNIVLEVDSGGEGHLATQMLVLDHLVIPFVTENQGFKS